MDRPRLNLFKDILWGLVLVGLVASIIRFSQGLGSATGLNDSAPWGLWIAFKLVFVALAGGGFTLAGIVYIFHQEKYRPILRRAILLALLGYGSFIVSLLFDLGLPWHIYMPMIHWQHHSVMFEIAWCVILYFTVLVVEFSPALLEHPRFNHPFIRTLLQWLHRLTLPVITAGIVLSTLHQSSLGSLFLIMPHRVHPLWYSPWIPYLFFTSAISAGLMALVVESFIVERWFNQGLHLGLLRSLAKLTILPLSLYLILRLGDLWLRGVLPGAIDGSWQSLLFLSEIIIGGFLPLILLSVKKIRQSREGLLTSALLIISGIISQRMSLSMLTMYRPEGTSYVPSIGEIAIALMIPAAAGLIYLFFTENLKVIEGRPQRPQRVFAQQAGVFATWLANRAESLRTVVAHRSGFAVFIVALAVPILTYQVHSPATPVSAALGWEMLYIDGDRSGYVVEFPHLEHQLRLQEDEPEADACQTCHHLDLPGDETSACWQCHSDFYVATLIFDHSSHESALGGNQSCNGCHTGEHVQLSASICQECHESMSFQDNQTPFNMNAPGYLEALHTTCRGCHEAEAELQERPELEQCRFCHTDFPENSIPQATSVAEN